MKKIKIDTSPGVGKRFSKVLIKHNTKPLKGKKEYALDIITENGTRMRTKVKGKLADKYKELPVYYGEKEVKSAVEWLLSEFDCRYEHGANKEQLKEAIKMAFEDVK